MRVFGQEQVLIMISGTQSGDIGEAGERSGIGHLTGSFFFFFPLHQDDPWAQIKMKFPVRCTVNYGGKAVWVVKHLHFKLR